MACPSPRPRRSSASGEGPPEAGTRECCRTATPTGPGTRVESGAATPARPEGSPSGEDRDQGAVRAARDGPARRDDSRPDREAAAQGGVGRPKRGRLAPPSTPMRSRCGLAGRLRGPPVFRRRRLPASLTSPGAPTTTTSRGHLAGGRPTRPPCAGLRGVGLSKKMSASPSAMNALHVRSVPLPRGPNDASAPLSATLPIRLARATWARVCVAHADLASVRRVKHLATRQALHVLSS